MQATSMERTGLGRGTRVNVKSPGSGAPMPLTKLVSGAKRTITALEPGKKSEAAAPIPLVAGLGTALANAALSKRS